MVGAEGETRAGAVELAVLQGRCVAHMDEEDGWWRKEVSLDKGVGKCRGQLESKPLAKKVILIRPIITTGEILDFAVPRRVMSMLLPVSVSFHKQFKPLSITPATSLVENLLHGRHANILLLGDGDPRKFFYTMYSEGDNGRGRESN